MPLPPIPYDACDKVSTRATSISMVRYRNNDYSVPVAYAHHAVQIRGYVHEVIIGCGTEVIARHRRSYEKADCASSRRTQRMLISHNHRPAGST